MMTEQELREIGKKNPHTGSQGSFVARRGRAAALLRRFILFGYYNLIERHVPEGSKVLDFGCGGGTVWLAQRYRVTGLESSEDSVRACQELYGEVVGGDICHAPFLAESFDAVVSKFVLEHLPEKAVPEAISEVARILRPGGLFVSLCDLECDHPQLAWVRRNYPETYHRLYILDPGHVGLRRSEAWKSIIEDTGLEVVDWSETSRFPILDHHPIGQLSKALELPAWARWSGRLALKIASIPILCRLWTITTPIVEAVIGPWLPRRWSYRLVFAARKPQSGFPSS